MRIWLWSVLIIKTGGEQTLYIATDHVWRQAYTVNTLSRWNMAFFLWLHPAEKGSLSLQYVLCESCRVSEPLYQMYTVLGTFDQSFRGTLSLSLRCCCFSMQSISQLYSFLPPSTWKLYLVFLNGLYSLQTIGFLFNASSLFHFTHFHTAMQVTRCWPPVLSAPCSKATCYFSHIMC